MSSNFGFLQELLTTVADTSRTLLPKRLFAETDGQRGLQALVDALMAGQGEASGMAIANQLLRHYDELDQELRLVFFRYIGEVLKPDAEAVKSAAAAYQAAPSEAALATLQEAVESPKQEFFRRLNMAPGATAKIVAMRKELLGFMRDDPSLTEIDRDLFHLLQSWFNRGFLVLRRIDWQTPAAILEKIIAYEAVHEIDGWDDLRRRLEPADRRCFGFFHPSLVDEPLIFVEVALTDSVSSDIASLLQPLENEAGSVQTSPTTAVFYSISNCQEGLRGVSFGNFLIKQVVDELSKEFASLNTFVTLSPVPRFAQWLDQAQKDYTETGILSAEERAALGGLRELEWWDNEATSDGLCDVLLALAAKYFLDAKDKRGQPIDPVARFHLGNGARLERINWMADLSGQGLKQSHGLMVNYLYDTREIEANHEAYANEGTVAASRVVKGYLKSGARGTEKSTLPSLRLTTDRS
ncbi:MAG: malonyl-CoA decarboxylase [Hyphomicrobiaceae bacterium]